MEIIKMEKISLTDKEHWEATYKCIKYHEVSMDSDIAIWLNKHIKSDSNLHKTCFEVGIYPSSYSTIFGRMDYQINGIDRIIEVNKSMKDWLLSKGYDVGNLFCADFFEFKTHINYDIVCSFGFIEHFKNYEDVIRNQAKLVKDKGFIIIETPNFKGFVQYILKYLFDKENLDIHYIPSMNFNKWENVLIQEGFEILSKEYIGSFSFKTYPQKRNFIQKCLIKGINRYRYFIKTYLLKNTSRHYSPGMIMLAQKK